MVRDFVLSTREVDTLLGAEGKEGLVQRVLGDGPRIQRLREIVATACEERAELPVAIKLYHEVHFILFIASSWAHCGFGRLATTARYYPYSMGLWARSYPPQARIDRLLLRWL